MNPTPTSMGRAVRCYNPGMNSTRRDLLAGFAAMLAPACAPRAIAPVAIDPVVAERATPAAAAPFAAIEASAGGRVGVFALDLHDGAELARRADERFAMCSTFKWILAAGILAAVDQGKLTLSQQVPFSERDLLEYAPTTRARLAEGRLSVEELARATVVNSDNTAANLLFPLVGGPQGLTAFVRANGDAVTRFDRDEPALNTNLPDDPRDTTTPRAMVALLRTFMTRDADAGPLTRESRGRLLGWLIACETGHERLRASLPADWLAADKTGTGARSAVNDVGILEPPGRSPIMVAAFLSDSGKAAAELNPAHAEIARELVGWVRARSG